jgi:ELWxxDGT repeat protein
MRTSRPAKPARWWPAALLLAPLAPLGATGHAASPVPVLVRDIDPAGDASPIGFANVDGILFFRASDGASGVELWKSDGTDAGTVRVKDINPGPASSDPELLTSVGGTLFFKATDGTSGTELWRSDGTEAGTVRVRDINPGPGDGLPSFSSTGFLLDLNGTLFFRADDGTATRRARAAIDLILDPQTCIGQYPCFESPGFAIRVVDRETAQPLSGVHGLAEWIVDGGWGGRRIFMAQDAVSGLDGRLVFPAWGPFRGYEPGMAFQMDPAVTLFRAGYLPEADQGRRIIFNATPPGQKETTRIRRFGQDGATFGMEPFRGDTEGWLAYLMEAARPDLGAGVSKREMPRVRAPLRSRLERVQAELETLPQDREEVKKLKDLLDRMAQSWRETP